MARVKGDGTPRSTPSTRFPAATAFTRSRGETPVKPGSGNGARRRSASPATSRSRHSRSRSRSCYDNDGDDAQTIVAAPVVQNHDHHDDAAAQVLRETRSVSLGAAPSDEAGGSSDENESDGHIVVNEEEESSEREYEEAQEDAQEEEGAQEEEDAQDVEMQDTHEPELAEEEAEEDPDEGEFEIEKICNFQLVEAETRASDSAATAPTAPAVLLDIKWRGFPRSANTLEPEAAVQTSAGPLLYAFWAARGGRDKALRLSPQTAGYVPFRILEPVPPPPAAAAAARRRGKRRGRPKMPRYLVQWVGYDVDQATPETERKLRDVAPELLDKYLGEHPAAAFSPRFPE